MWAPRPKHCILIPSCAWVERLSSSFVKTPLGSFRLLFSSYSRRTPPTPPRSPATAPPPSTPPFLTTPVAFPTTDPSLPGSGGASDAGSAAHELATAGSASTVLPPSVSHQPHPRYQPWPNRSLYHPSGLRRRLPFCPHPTTTTDPAATPEPPSKSSGHGRSPTPNPQTITRTLRPPASTAARARRRPAVGRPAHQLPELEKMAGDSGVTFCLDLLLFSFFPLLASVTSFFPYLGGSPSKSKWRGLSI
jgi:hypothetical protein